MLQMERFSFLVNKQRFRLVPIFRHSGVDVCLSRMALLTQRTGWEEKR